MPCLTTLGVTPPLLAAGKIHWTEWVLSSFSDPWVFFGFAAQAVFASRFIVQWLASERRGVSIVPVVFWHLSIVGSAMLCVYAIHRKDPVFILGQSLNMSIYVRNLMLIYRPRSKPPAGVDP
ncbi:MAG: lipid-A-disaccharide synthase N-terminal domain-containing protein [Phycisphaerae bacterium]|nr:lipid-A-disaccharide synthase N-terminal domain-containing protein [Phycisphaerae bacterium]NUQ47210.1 lipid-A-disaccharide synthase N-terminal domain-containing protein [Phycisphaerae bacterium]